jgi:nitrous oxide reductase accessory protein NosL
MKTETRLENKWYQQLQDAGTEITAEELLHIMRPEVETILSQFPDWDNPAVSQSLRASAILPLIEERIRSKMGLEKTVPFLRQRRILQDFLAVHRTVWILEGRPL